MDGYIYLHRQIIEHWLWTKKRIFSEVEAWLDILLEVRWKQEPTKPIKIKNRYLVCNHAESICSLETWAKRWNWNKSKVVRFLDVLKKDNMIDTQNETVTIRLKVLNYDIYQCKRNDNETITERERNASETQLKPNNKDNKENKEKNSSSSKLEISKDAIKFSNWFKSLLPDTVNISESVLKNWSITYDDMIRIDKRTKDEIKAVCIWARNDEFWKDNFLTAIKLRKKKDGIMYYDVFLQKMNNGQSNEPKYKSGAEAMKEREEYERKLNEQQ
jgi:hypothetical protein